MVLEAEVGVVFLEGDHRPENEGKPLESGKGKKQIPSLELTEGR